MTATRVRVTAPEHRDPSRPDTRHFDAVMHARQRFVAMFAERCDAMEALAHEPEPGRATALASLAQLAHRMSGLGGSVGLPRVGACAAELELLLTEGADRATVAAVDAMLARLRGTFASELSSVPTWSASPHVKSAERLTVCIVEDDPEQRALTASWVEQAGHRAVALDSADALLDALQTLRPSIILLDVNMPGLNGYAACQMLKADPDLAGIPIVFMTARTGLSDRVTGLALGADDYVCKPFDPSELVLRLKLLALKRAAGGRHVEDDSAGVSSETAFLPPEESSPQVRDCTVMVIDDDPEVSTIVEAYTSESGYRTVVCADGEEAVNMITLHRPDVIVLDLALPAVSGFDLLEAMGRMERRPRVVVLSARNREQDVVRAFELDADDYVTKPFNPRELLARIGRLAAMAANQTPSRPAPSR